MVRSQALFNKCYVAWLNLPLLSPKLLGLRMSDVCFCQVQFDQVWLACNSEVLKTLINKKMPISLTVQFVSENCINYTCSLCLQFRHISDFLYIHSVPAFLFVRLFFRFFLYSVFFFPFCSLLWTVCPWLKIY